MKDDLPPQAAVFDLGGVIIEVSVEAIPRHWARALEVPLSEVLNPFLADVRYQLMERGEISMRQYHEHLVARLGRAMPFDDFVAGWNSLLRGLLPGVEELLARLCRHLRLVMLTNTNATHAAQWRVDQADVLRHFERVFVSYEMRARKPEPGCFRQVLEYLALEPPRVVFIDDAAENVAAAEGLGMKGIVAAGADQIAESLRAMGVPVET